MVEARITAEPIPLAELLAEGGDPAHGAQAVFTGMVRNHNQGKAVVGVSYDTFSPLATKVFREIAEGARKQWGEDLSLRIWHRVGRLGVGELSVVIVAASRHRDESFRACRYVIEEIKHRAPLWKQEHYVDGDSAWLQGHALCSHGPAAARPPAEPAP